MVSAVVPSVAVASESPVSARFLIIHDSPLGGRAGVGSARLVVLVLAVVLAVLAVLAVMLAGAWAGKDLEAARTDNESNIPNFIFL